MNKPLILVVEDDSAVRNLITTTLETQNYRCQIAPTGEAAILEAASYNPDVILLDLGLPDIDGIEIIRKIRSWAKTPIIVISARSEDTDKIDALDAGADDFNEEDDCYEILTSPEEFDAVNQALADAGVTFASAEVTMIPQTTVDLTSEDDIKKMNRILGLLDEDDDVQNVYHNWNEPEEDEE